MAEKATKVVGPETQKERWVKYGANVGVSIILVVVVAGLVVYLANKVHRRMDTTETRVNSLKPQTLAILNEVKSPIEIVSLYTRTNNVRENQAEYVEAVDDLLDEYKRHSGKIEVQSIDPVSNPAKVDDLVKNVINKYSGEIKKYQGFVEAWPGVYKQMSERLSGQAALPALNKGLAGGGEQDRLGQIVKDTLDGLVGGLKDTNESVERLMQQKVPDYKGATDRIQERLEKVSEVMAALVKEADAQRPEEQSSAETIKYLAENKKEFTEIQKLADEQVAKIKGLGELKLDTLRQQLSGEQGNDAILVLGENEMRVIPFRQVWQEDAKNFEGTNGEKVKPRFAGEQQVSTAILALTSNRKQRVVFVRGGGPPIASPGFPPFLPSGPFARFAARLADYNFEVKEKDLSGTWARSPQARQMPSAPEASDEEMKDAIWIVLPSPPAQGPQGPPPIGQQVAEHLSGGGSAMLLFEPQGDNLSGALDEWGVSVRTDAVAVHELVQSDRQSGNLLEDIERIPFMFVMRDYGEHLLTRPLKSLDGLLFPLNIVQVQQRKGYTAMAILPVPTSPKAWGETNLQTVEDQSLKFDEATDLKPPLYAGAVVEKEKGGRIVAIGCSQFLANQFLTAWDPQLLKQGRRVSLLPGNAELGSNAIFWLAHMEPMIAISPSAMEASRIGTMSGGTLKAWRVGMLLVGLPLAVVLAGALMYVRRRD